MKKILRGRFFLSFLLLFCLLSSFSIIAYSDNPDDLYEEGQNYLIGNGVDQDISKGISLILEAANAGSTRAMIQIGTMYSSQLGKLLSDDFVEGSASDLALEWYEKAADAGAIDAAATAITRDAFFYFLGTEDGRIQEDDATALRYFEKAAEYGNPEAINMMVAFYSYGFGVEQDPDKALELSSKLADQGNEEALLAMEEYAYAYYAGTKDGIDINFSTAFQYYMRLTNYGNERAMYNVGLLYEYGLGVTADHAQAITWLTKAAEIGYKPAEDMLIQLEKRN